MNGCCCSQNWWKTDATMIVGLVITLYLSNRVRKSSCLGSKLSLHDVNVSFLGVAYIMIYRSTNLQGSGDGFLKRGRSYGLVWLSLISHTTCDWIHICIWFLYIYIHAYYNYTYCPVSAYVDTYLYTCMSIYCICHVYCTQFIQLCIHSICITLWRLTTQQTQLYPHL